MPKQPAPRSIDEYIAGFPPDLRKTLKKIRLTVSKAAPAAEETIKYGMPTFTLKGNLVFFAAFQDHIGFYPLPKGFKPQKELSPYKGSKGTLKFPLDQPIPYDLIRRIVKSRVKENLQRAHARQKK